MSEFTLIDLGSQANAFVRYVQGWQAADILQWLRQHGRVVKISNPYDDSQYLYCSRLGIETGFRFTAEGQLVVLSDHSIYPQKQH